MSAVDKKDYPYYDQYSKHILIIKGLQESTYRNYDREIRLFFAYLDKEYNPKIREPVQIEPLYILKYLNSEIKRSGNPDQIRYRILLVLRSYFDFLDRYGYLKGGLNPTLRFKLKKPKKRLPVYLTLEEAEKFLEAANTGKYAVRDHAMFRFLLQTGCRMGELLNLRLDSSFDFEAWKVRITGKGNRERIIPLTEKTCRALQEYLKVRKPAEKGEQAFFLNSQGRPIRASTVRRQFRMICNKAGLHKAGLTVHKLRHTCLTLLLNAGVDLVTLKQIAGHQYIRTTAVYLHVSEEQLRRAVEKHPFG
jgi:site-specific recombinase XerD